ncbi:MAG: hypothetical protein GVY13_16840 [Alphaproteobacteria bacterium]|nr:hypothetical protein [Alphaproteobacteria bacterium]
MTGHDSREPIEELPAVLIVELMVAHDAGDLVRIGCAGAAGFQVPDGRVKCRMVPGKAPGLPIHDVDMDVEACRAGLAAAADAQAADGLKAERRQMGGHAVAHAVPGRHHGRQKARPEPFGQAAAAFQQPVIGVAPVPVVAQFGHTLGLARAIVVRPAMLHDIEARGFGHPMNQPPGEARGNHRQSQRHVVGNGDAQQPVERPAGVAGIIVAPPEGRRAAGRGPTVELGREAPPEVASRARAVVPRTRIVHQPSTLTSPAYIGAAAALRA